ncbi:MAG: penicillin acylase family protein, partial [Flavobacteriales bacterium]
PSKSKNQKPILCNDTHIGYGLPQTWYEAHLQCPNFEVYGHYMAGIPFPLVGRSVHHSWGLTMLLNDDMDFYREELSADGHHYLVDGQERSLEERDEWIHVKGAGDTLVHVRCTHRGPMIERIFEATPQVPVSMLWTYTRELSDNLEALHIISTTENMDTFEHGLSLIHAPGLNVTYADSDGHIGWWACAHLLNRPEHVNSWTLIDGRQSANDPLGYIPFDHNPRSIDPACGYVYSANDWPGAIHDGDTSFFYPGYYKPPYRGDRIQALLQSQEKFSSEDMQGVLNDVIHDVDARLYASWLDIAKSAEQRGELPTGTYEKLFGAQPWNGSYAQTETAPTCYNHILYFFLQNTLRDELGSSRFNLFMQTHQVQRSYWILWNQANSKWYDVTTTPQAETREQIVIESIREAVDQMEDLFGAEANSWTWNRSATLELKHPLGEVALLRPFFNIGAKPMDGGNETIHQAGYKLDSTGVYKFFFGSQMRIIESMDHIDQGWNVTPSGQSGHVMSPYFGDQSELYRTHGFRKMHRRDYQQTEALTFHPK